MRSEDRISRSDDLENNQCVDSHLDLRNDTRTILAVDLDIARNSLQDQDSGTSIDTGDIEEANKESQTSDLKIQRGSKFANDIVKSNDLEVHFDLNSENDLERIDVTNKINESENKTTGTSCDLSSSASCESTAGKLHSPVESDLLSGNDLEETRELDLGVVLDSISEQRASDNLQEETQVPPPATEAMPAAPKLDQNPKSEASSNEDSVSAEASFTIQNGGFEQEVRIVEKLENTGDDRFLSQSKPESGLQDPTRSPSSIDANCARESFAEYFEHKENDGTAGKLENIEADNRSESQRDFLLSAQNKDENCNKEISGESFEHKKRGGKPGKLEGTEYKELTCQPGDESDRESTLSDGIDKDGSCEEATSDLGILDENYDEQETEDSTYTVTSGGKIVPESVAESDGDVVAREGWLLDREGGQGVEDTRIVEKLRSSKNNHSPPSKNNSSDRNDVEGSPVNRLNETKPKERTGTSNESFEDPVYTVTSGGQIVSGWTDFEDPTPDGASHTIPEVDQQHLIVRTTVLDLREVSEESSSATGNTDVPEACSNQPEKESETSEVLVTGSETLLRKQEDPVSRIGACVILREEDIEKMRERRINGSSQKNEKKKKKTGR